MILAVKINCLVSNPPEGEGSQMVSAGVHRPKNTFLSHCFHMASKHVVKAKNWRKEWFLLMCKDELLTFYSAVRLLYLLIHATGGWKWTGVFAACNSRAQMLCWPYSAWLPACPKNTFLATFESVCLPFSSSVPGYSDQMPCWAKLSASHLFGSVNQILCGFLGLGGVEQTHQE